MIWEILLILFLILLNGFFAMSEMAVVAARKARLVARAAKGDRRARQVLQIAERPGRFLSTVQIGITLVGILTGAIGGATVGQRLADMFAEIPVLAPVAEAAGFAVVVIVTTYLSLILGELVPKQLALRHPERIAARIAGPMGTLSVLAKPIVLVLEGSSNLVMKAIGLRKIGGDHVSEEEIRVLIAEGTKAGVFDPAEKDMMIAVMRLADRPARAFMTPRPDIDWLDLDDSPEETQRKLLASKFSRLPVGKGSLDEVVGVVQRTDLLDRYLKGKSLKLAEIVRQVPVVHDAASALKVLQALKESEVHLALVVDEYGALEGLVTSTDVLEAIVGEFREQGVEPALVHRREDGSWLMDGGLPTHQVQDALGLIDFPTDRSFHTLAGFVLGELEHVPTPGEHFEWNGFRFEVVDMDGRRIDKVLVSRIEAEPEEALSTGARSQ
ncbi:MAG TPA: hemolysin family protein [Alphaproteobacteria bacterium]|nr:hemolysin family protein [Alphaproteobacteria bacterium]